MDWRKKKNIYYEIGRNAERRKNYKFQNVLKRKKLKKFLSSSFKRFKIYSDQIIFHILSQSETVLMKQILLHLI